ncbi:MAG: D-alanyl-D-alanine carboxypeptidase family protein [Peptostreptococcaceae bacterium]
MKKILSLIICTVLFTTNISISLADELSISSTSAILMDVSSGQVIYEKNSHEKLPPASVTKVMTMLLIMEALENNKITLEDQVPISENASSMGGSQVFLEAGETQKVDDLIKAIAVASANDGCVAMAEYIGGSVVGFVDMMNKKATELGMKDTNFVNTNGLPVENHYTTAYDIALMSKELLSHDAISKYLNTWMDTIVVGKNKTSVGLVNTNKLVKHYEGTTGVKTGFTNEAKYCLSASAKRGDTHLVSVTLGATTSPERFKDATSLLNYGFMNYETIKLLNKDSEVQKIEFDKADSDFVEIVCKDDLNLLVKKDQSKEFVKKVVLDENVQLPIKKGDKLGTYEVYQDEKLVGSVDLITTKDINKASYLQMFKKVINNLI